MKTILLPRKSCPVLFLLILLSASLPVFGQTLSTSQNSSNPNQFEFTVNFPPLMRMSSTSPMPFYDLYVHYGDGNVEHFEWKNYDGSTAGPSFMFRPWTKTYSYAQENVYTPFISFTAKYTPPTPPERDFTSPTSGLGGFSSSGNYSMAGRLRGDRDLVGIVNRHIAMQPAKLTTLTLAWRRAGISSESSIAVFYGGLRDQTTNVLSASDPLGNSPKGTLAISRESRPHLVQFTSTDRFRVAENSSFATLNNKYDSVLVINNLTPDSTLEGRFFLNLRNKRELYFRDTMVSIFGVFLSPTAQNDTNALKKLGGADYAKLKQLGLQVVPGGFLRIGNRFVRDFFFYEIKPVYVHDPNELVIAKMTKNSAGNFDLKLDYTSCSQHKSNSNVDSAYVYLYNDHKLMSGTLKLVAAEHGTTSLGFEPDTTITVPEASFVRKIKNIDLPPGECFVMHFTGTLAAADSALVHEDGKILHGCVELAGESNPDPAEICRANRKLEKNIGPQDPCDQTGFWNKIKCLCAVGPIPCWILVILALIFLLWLFFKKKN